MRKEIENTLKQAREDFDTAKAIIKIEKYFASAFFSQQAAEKALKALYMIKFRELLRTHDLTELCEKLSCPDKVMKAAIKLNPSYVVTRYVNAANGVPANMHDEEVATAQLNNASIILKWVENLIK